MHTGRLVRKSALEVSWVIGPHRHETHEGEEEEYSHEHLRVRGTQEHQSLAAQPGPEPEAAEQHWQVNTFSCLEDKQPDDVHFRVAQAVSRGRIHLPQVSAGCLRLQRGDDGACEPNRYMYKNIITMTSAASRASKFETYIAGLR